MGLPGLAEDGPQVGDEEAGEQGGRDDPGGEALDDPVDLPRPTLDAAEGDEVGGGAEAADPVEDNAEKRIGSQDASLPVRIERMGETRTIVYERVAIVEIESLLEGKTEQSLTRIKTDRSTDSRLRTSNGRGEIRGSIRLRVAKCATLRSG